MQVVFPESFVGYNIVWNDLTFIIKLEKRLVFDDGNRLWHFLLNLTLTTPYEFSKKIEIPKRGKGGGCLPSFWAGEGEARDLKIVIYQKYFCFLFCIIPTFDVLYKIFYWFLNF